MAIYEVRNVIDPPTQDGSKEVDAGSNEDVHGVLHDLPASTLRPYDENRSISQAAERDRLCVDGCWGAVHDNPIEPPTQLSKRLRQQGAAHETGRIPVDLAGRKEGKSAPQLTTQVRTHWRRSQRNFTQAGAQLDAEGSMLARRSEIGVHEQDSVVGLVNQSRGDVLSDRASAFPVHGIHNQHDFGSRVAESMT